MVSGGAFYASNTYSLLIYNHFLPAQASICMFSAVPSWTIHNCTWFLMCIPNALCSMMESRRVEAQVQENGGTF